MGSGQILKNGNGVAFDGVLRERHCLHWQYVRFTWGFRDSFWLCSILGTTSWVLEAPPLTVNRTPIYSHKFNFLLDSLCPFSRATTTPLITFLYLSPSKHKAPPSNPSLAISYFSRKNVRACSCAHPPIPPPGDLPGVCKDFFAFLKNVESVLL